MRLPRYAYPVAFAAFSLALLLGWFVPFMRETGEMTPFFTTRDFARETLAQVGGGLYWVASALQGSLARPLLGALLLTGVLVGVGCAVRWAFGLRGPSAGLCWMAPLALLLSYTQTGYMLYVEKTPGVAFTAALGTLAATLLSKCWARAWWMRLVWMALVCGAGYWLMGFYALLAEALVAALLAGNALAQRSMRPVAWMAAMAVVGLMTPRILWGQGLLLMRAEDLYRAGLPDYLWHSGEQSLFYPIVASCVLVVAAAALRGCGRTSPWEGGSAPSAQGRVGCLQRLLAGHVVAAAVVVACGAGVAYLSMRDANFRHALQMKHRAEEGDWEGVLSVAREASGMEPTRLEVNLTRLALWKTGRMGDELFRYPDGDAPYRAPRQPSFFRLMGASLLYYHYGKVNYSYRWAMEDLVEYGARPAYLKYMVKTAILNGERDLAEKCLGLLEHTLFHQAFAARYRRLLDGVAWEGDALRTDFHDEEMNAIRPLMQYGNVLDGDAGVIESFLLKSFAITEGGSREIVELSLMNNLITKNLVGVWPRFRMLLPTWEGKVPRHYQEAMLLVAQLQGYDSSRLPVDAGVRQRFARIVEASARLGDNAAAAEALRTEFGDTYWYYYFFVKGMKTF